MLRSRIIPCLLIKDKGLVKSVKFKDFKYVGDPTNAVRIFNEKQVDELMVLEIDATAQGRQPDLDLISRLARECRMPLCYGGGVSTVEQASRIINLGVEKVALSSAIVANPNLIAEISRELGSQSVVVVVDVRKRLLGKGYDIWTHNGTRKSALNLSDFVKSAQDLGAGEIVVNSIDHDGTMAGYDLPLARLVREATTVPLTILGGAGSLDHVQELITEFGIVGASAGSLFVFKGPYRAVLINYPTMEQRLQITSAAQKSRQVR